VRLRFGRKASHGPFDLDLDLVEELEEQPVWLDPLDEAQRAAVHGHDGVVQVIAPAGSGKTRVIAARVQELRSRGAAANRILCCTFNRDAVAELKKRLRAANEQQVEVRGFHGVGWKIIDAAHQMREDVRQTTYAEWRFLAREAMKGTHDGVWIDPPDAQNAISRFKLSELRSPDEAEAALGERPTVTPLERTEVALYRLHEQFLKKQNRFDYDDLIFRAVTLLRTDAMLREEWQKRFDHVLVDEFQDIEQAQERLVQILAAPQDGLFCVGDEDQCIYSWRRASVQRIVDLDQLYPGLQRFSLPVNYRCGRLIVEASRTLIEHNEHRFEKAIGAAPSAPDGEVIVIAATSLDAQVREVARQAEGAKRGDLVVLARTTNLLRQTAAAFARRGIVIDAPETVVSDSGANGLLVTYLRLFASLRHARADDISSVFRVPNRYLPDTAAEGVATRLRAGRSFADALDGAECGEEWRVERLTEAAALFDRLASIESAAEFIHLVRSDGGLDRHYAEQQQLTAHDQSAIDLLENAERRAEGMTVAEFADVLDHETQLIKSHLSAELGIELRTIHGAKGREWPTVYVVGVDEGHLPHRRSLAADGSSGLEDERRLAYVAMTRAAERLVMTCTQGTASRFISEAALRPVALDKGDGPSQSLAPERREPNAPAARVGIAGAGA
jgi:superfamily I DNA/RNA helicase